MHHLKKKKIIFILGPTGIGKSAAALILAKKLNGEIVSCDSMQVYKKMNILTSKLKTKDTGGIKHYLIDIITPSQEYNVARYRADALSICDKLYARNKVPLFVGGSGLYYSIIVDGLFPKVEASQDIRVRLDKELVSKGSKYLYSRLVKVDQAAAAKIHPNDSRRIIRALEVYLITGKPISCLQKTRVGLGKEYEIKALGLNLNREALYQRIDSRVESMLKSGLIKEVKGLLKNKLSKTAKSAIGIAELDGYFKGRYSLEEAIRLIKRNSRHYAKRQYTWFNKDKRIKWVKILKSDSPRDVAIKLWKKLF